jgi:predicted ester cyclase
VVARLSWSGTQRGLFLGIPATNRRVAVAGVYAWRVADGKIREEWIAEDLLSLMQQLGRWPKRLPG